MEYNSETKRGKIPDKHYAKSKKSGTQYYQIYYLFPKRAKNTAIENKSGVAKNSGITVNMFSKSTRIFRRIEMLYILIVVVVIQVGKCIFKMSEFHSM